MLTPTIIVNKITYLGDKFAFLSTSKWVYILGQGEHFVVVFFFAWSVGGTRALFYSALGGTFIWDRFAFFSKNLAGYVS